jgi:hypothetical protein
MTEKIKGYKAFNKDWTCRDFQYEVGKTYKTDKKEMCSEGFHFCLNSCEVIKYYPDADCKYAMVEAKDIETRDNKSVCTEITIIKEITKNELLQAHKEAITKKPKTRENSTTGEGAHSSTTGDRAHSSTTGDKAHSSTTGDKAHSSTTGDKAHSSTTGYNAHSSTTGYNAYSSTTGDRAHSSTTGYEAHSSTTGYEAHSSTTGDNAHSSTTGDNAHSSTTGYEAHSSTTGENTVSISTGIISKAKTEKGFITIANWVYEDKWVLKEVCSQKVGKKLKGKTLKPNTWYWFEDNKLMEEKAK